ncbi:replication initiation O-like [Vibrio phage D290]
MSMLLMVKAMKIKVGNPTRKLVLLKLADNANDDGVCWPSYQNIADHAECDKRTAMRHISHLEKDGLLWREYRKGEKGNSSNKYHLTLDPSDKMSPPSDRMSPTPSDPVSPRTSHSLEPVNEPINDSPKGKSNDYPDEFEWIWANKPQREGGNPKKQAYSACKARLKEGVTWRELAEGLNRYRAYCIAKRIVNTSTVQQMSTFFGTKESFKESWTVNHEATINNGSSSQPSQNATSRVSAALEKQRAEFNGSSEAMGNTDGVLHGQVHQEERGGSFIDLDNGDWSSK